MIVGRLLGYLLILAAVVTLVWDAVILLISGQWSFLTLGELWYRLDPGSLNTLQAGIQRNLHPWLWDFGLQPLITWPAVAVLGVLGALLAAVFRRRKRRAVFREERGIF